jgi:DMSO/TMAO reductase YedYZ molybdopterin-dependent catalytic subunit
MPNGPACRCPPCSIAKAREDVLLAYQMNGQELPPEHGFPVRAIVPGWYAVASIKWLQRIIVTRVPFQGYYQTLDYAYWSKHGELANLVPISEMEVKAEISRPAANEIVPAKTKVRMHGAAWSSGGEITRVEVSTDGGSSWHGATLLGPSQPNAWRLWEYEWQTPDQPGKHTLLARATDSRQRTQPLERDLDRGTYMINHLLRINVEVK